MGSTVSCLRKDVSQKPSDDDDEHKQPLNKEADENKKSTSLKEKEDEEDAQSYLEVEEGIFPQTPTEAQDQAPVFGAAGENKAYAMKRTSKLNLFSSRQAKCPEYTTVNYKSNNLYAIVRKFQYQSPENDALLAAKCSSPIIKQSIINNNSPASLSHKVNYSEGADQTFVYEFSDKFMNVFENIELDRSEPLFVSVNAVKHQLEIGSAALTSHFSPLRMKDKRYRTYIKYSATSVEKCLEIPANSSLEIMAYQERLENVIIPFTAELEISRWKGKQVFSGESIKKYLKKLNLTVESVNENSIALQVTGKLNASFNLESVFTINSINN